MIQIKRAYEKQSKRDGYRVLVDRLWPRGLRKTEVRLDEWLRELAPSNELRKRFAHDPERWKEFRSEYKKELRRAEAREAIRKLAALAHGRTLTLVYSARDAEHNNAVVLKEVIDRAA